MALNFLPIPSYLSKIIDDSIYSTACVVVRVIW